MRPHRRGTTAVLLALSSGVLFAFSAVVIDAGYARVVQAELQTAADAGAFAAVRKLDGTADGVTRARAAAVELAGLNFAGGDAVVIDPNTSNAADGDVVMGVWNGTDFTPSSDPLIIDAVYVSAHSTTMTSALTEIGFATAEFEIGAASTAEPKARGGAAEVAFYLPFGLPKCQVDALSKATLATMTFALNPATADNTGWGLIGQTVNTAAVKAHLQAIGPCVQEWDEQGWLEDVCTTAVLTDSLWLTNGVATPSLTALADAVVAGVPWDSTVWGTMPARNAQSAIPAASYGKMLAAPIPVFDGGAGYCSDSSSWNQAKPIAGFVWGAVYDVRSSGSASQKNVWLKIDPVTYRDLGAVFGGPDYGVVWVAPAAVVK